jgi:hypothetical protein
MGELIGNLGNMGGTHWEFGPELASSWSSLLGLEFFFKKTEDDLLVLGLENIFKN